MAIIRIFDRRSEARTAVDVALTIWGVDNKGERFLQEARAHDISLSGALLTGVDSDLRSGDIVGILYAGRKARFRVVWVRYDGAGDKMQVAVHRLAADACPWQGFAGCGSGFKCRWISNAARALARRLRRNGYWVLLLHPHRLRVQELAHSYCA